ncbi:MAG: tyrosine-type recombinase/integrase [Actinomycetota bacterium]|nr:tyrosine-type recombinase/integrase [Actinomycetota bacterium]
MPGHIYKTPKGWRAMVDIGADRLTGRRRQRRIGPFHSRREADLAAAKVIAEAASGQVNDPRAITVAQYLREHWLPAREVRGVKPTTLANYRWICEAYLIPRLGQTRLGKLAPADVAAFFAAFSKEAGRGGKLRSARTIALTHRVLSMALAHAVRSGVLARNPAEGARDDLPRATPAAETAIWTPEQLGQFLEAMIDDRLYALWVLAATTGMRRGELCGLRWDDVDIDEGLITVRRARVMVHGVATETGPKTSAGERALSLDEVTIDVLADHRRRQRSEEVACAPGFWHAEGYVFADEVGRALIPEYVTKGFTRAAHRVGLPQIRLHDLRHSYATAMLQAGVDVKVVAGRLGHASTVITQNVYQHRVERLDRDAANRVAALIFDKAQ